MTRPLDPVDAAVARTWFSDSGPEPTKAAFAMVRSHRQMFTYLAEALVRDLPASFERDAAIQRLRESWHWAASCVLQLGPAE